VSVAFANQKVTDKVIDLHSELMQDVRTVLIYPEFRERANSLHFHLFAGQIFDGAKTFPDDPFHHCDFKVENMSSKSNL